MHNILSEILFLKSQKLSHIYYYTYIKLIKYKSIKNNKTLQFGRMNFH